MKKASDIESLWKSLKGMYSDNKLYRFKLLVLRKDTHFTYYISSNEAGYYGDTYRLLRGS